jgi:hypothetical protein
MVTFLFFFPLFSCGACREIAMSMHGSVTEADLSGETVEFGHRVQGAKSARKSIQYARSEAHITDLVSEFCASKHMDVKAFVAVGLRKDTQEWVFLTKTDLKDKETMNTIGNTMVLSEWKRFFSCVFISHFILFSVTFFRTELKCPNDF